MGLISGSFPYPAYELLRDNNEVCSFLFAFYDADSLNVHVSGHTDLANGQYVSGNFFQALGVTPAAGRLLSPHDDRRGASPAAVLAFDFAQRYFPTAASARGKSIVINSTSFTITGVAPPQFYGVTPGDEPDVYLPLQAASLLETNAFDNDESPYLDEHFYWLQIMARLRPGVTRAHAQAALALSFQQYVTSTASSQRERTDLPTLGLEAGAQGLDFLRRQYSAPLYILMSLVGIILALACGNVAHLLLARATIRRREIGVRLSLGATRWRIARQLLTESLLLASLGGVLGLAVAVGAVRALTWLIADGREDFTLYAELNHRVLGVMVVLSLSAGLFFGLAPALQSIRVRVGGVLRSTQGSEGSLEPRSSFRLSIGRALVVVQVALSLVLVVAAGLLARTLSNLNAVHLGFEPHNLALFRVKAPEATFGGRSLVPFYEDLRTRIGSIPGIRTATLSNFALVSGSWQATDVNVPGSAAPEHQVSLLSVGPAFFTTVGIPLLSGREIDRHDLSSDHRVAVVNEAFAETYFGKTNALGRSFGLGTDQATPDIEIVGISQNARYDSLKKGIPPVAYIPYSQSQNPPPAMVFQARTLVDPVTLGVTLRRVILETSPSLAMGDIITQARQIDRSISSERTFGILCTLFALLALLIAFVGLYGTIAYSVSRRASEIGIRMALGAQRSSVVWMVVRETLAVAAIGLALGVPIALGTSRVVRSFLFGVAPGDPLVLSLATGILVATAILAGCGPAWRASRVDPARVLRYE